MYENFDPLYIKLMPLRKNVISDFGPEVEILPFLLMRNKKWSKHKKM